MHRMIEEGLEDYLSGRAKRDFQAHLDVCAPCRKEIAHFQSVSFLFRETLAADAASGIEPSPEFYARLSQSVAQTAETRRSSSLWNVLAIDASFGRRVAFGSLMTLALLGGYLVSRESDIAPDVQGPEAIMASHDITAPHDTSLDRDRMMVALASYQN